MVLSIVIVYVCYLIKSRVPSSKINQFIAILNCVVFCIKWYGGYFKNVVNVRNAENRTECLNYDGRSNYLILEGLRLASSDPLLLV